MRAVTSWGTGRLAESDLCSTEALRAACPGWPPEQSVSGDKRCETAARLHRSDVLA